MVEKLMTKIEINPYKIIRMENLIDELEEFFKDEKVSGYAKNKLLNIIEKI